jgi:hypothetical protein
VEYLAKFGFYNTVDIDKGDYENFFMIYEKIQACSHHGVVMFRDTQKGYHILFKCDIECDLCRFVFDDPARYAYDFKKKPSRQNVCFKPFSARRLK